jgi:hypothetical protein
LQEFHPRNADVSAMKANRVKLVMMNATLGVVFLHHANEAPLK